jgi:hypothetical protein
MPLRVFFSALPDRHGGGSVISKDAKAARTGLSGSRRLFSVGILKKIALANRVF